MRFLPLRLSPIGWSRATYIQLFSVTAVLSLLVITAGVSYVSLQPTHAQVAPPMNLPAFPGAYGFGAKSIGGRGGRVLEITRLTCENRPGSFCWAINQPGPRTIVFRVSGTIEGGATITEPYLTIAGQTAPGGGITFTGELAIVTHDVIIRHIRVRRARFTGCTPEHANGTCETRNMLVYGNPTSPRSPVYNVILDHVSTSWGSDDMMGASGGDIHDVTIQNSIISEGLNRWTQLDPETGQPKPGLGLGMLFHCGARRVSVYRNLFAHNAARTPTLAAEAYTYPDGLPATLPDGRKSYLQNDSCPPLYQNEDAVFDVVNNVMYNWRDWAVMAYGKVKVNVVANYFKPGFDLNDGGRERKEIFLGFHDVPQIQTGRELFVADNYGGLSCPQGCTDQWQMVATVPVPPETRAANRLPTPLVPILSAAEAFEAVLSNAGAHRPFRDSVDSRAITDTRNGTGRQINNPSDVGGWPTLPTAAARTDSDVDGMTNDWEQLHDFNPNDPADGNQDRDGDGYTNVEEYLSELAGDPISAAPWLTITAPDHLIVQQGQTAQFTAQARNTQGGSVQLITNLTHLPGAQFIQRVVEAVQQLFEATSVEGQEKDEKVTKPIPEDTKKTPDTSPKNIEDLLVEPVPAEPAVPVPLTETPAPAPTTDTPPAPFASPTPSE